MWSKSLLSLFLVGNASVMTTTAFVAPSSSMCSSKIGSLDATVRDNDNNDLTTRRHFGQQALTTSIVTWTSTWFGPSVFVADATGRATLEPVYRRYGPRIRAGGDFYQTEFKQLVQKGDWEGIQAALREIPDRVKGDLNKPDAGVAQRARLAGGFSDARVLVAADLFASAFSSQNSISPKTKAMKASVTKLRSIIAEMDGLTKQALGQDTGGGFFGLGGKKKVNEAELLQQMRVLYAQGGNAWNEYIFAANDELALQFDRFEYVK